MTQQVVFNGIVNADTGEGWTSEGTTWYQMMWWKDICSGGDAGAQCHPAPPNNNFTWSATGRCEISGYLDPANYDPTSKAKATVNFHAKLTGSGKFDGLNVDISGSASQEEGGSVSLSLGAEGPSVHIEPGGSAAPSTISLVDVDDVTGNGACTGGEAFKLLGLAMTQAGIENSANEAFVQASTTIQTLQIQLLDPGTSPTGCPCDTKPHAGHTFDDVPVTDPTQCNDMCCSPNCPQ